MDFLSYAARSLGGVPAFRQLDPAQLSRLFAFTALKVIAKGEPAAIAGAVAGELSVIVSGRVAEVGMGPEAAEFGRGAALEAEAFFAQGPAAATLIALRETVLLTLGWDDLAAAFHANPDILASSLGAIGSGVAAPAPGNAVETPARIVLCAAGAKGRLEDDVKTALLSALEELAEVRVLRRESFGSIALDAPDAAHWLHEQELEFDLTVIAADPADADFAKAAIEEADEILFVGGNGGPALSALEEHALERRGARRCRLILAKGKGISGRQAGDWIAPRPYRSTQAIDLNSPAATLIASSLTGKGNAIAAASRGVYAAAILGALQAFESSGVPAVALAAAGSAILPAGLLAGGASLADTEAVFRELAHPQSFKRAVKSDAGLYEAAPADNALTATLPAFDIGLSERPFAALSLSLSRNAPRTHRQGRLQDAIRAGVTPPGMLAPFIADDGDILVSGEAEIEALACAAAELSASPLIVLYADAPGLGASEMSYRQLSGTSFWMTTFAPAAPEKRLRLESVLGAHCPRNPAGAAHRLGAQVFGVPVPEGVSPMDWPEWARLRDHAFDWTLAEIEARQLARD